MSDEILDFTDLTPIEIIIPIGPKKYALREASGDAAIRYRNAMLSATKIGPEGKPSGFAGMADTEPLLVSLCLFGQDPNNSAIYNEPIQQSTVRGWPQRVQKALYKKVKDISDLNEVEDDILALEKKLAAAKAKVEAVKNASSDTTVGLDSQTA